jgi:hypothetical protein
MARHSLRCGFMEENRELAGFSREFLRTTARVRVCSDCVAEGEGFEPSVRFCSAKPRRVRKLQ